MNKINLKPSGARIEKLLLALFPYPRTLVSQGFSDSLSEIKKIIPLNVLKFKSGEECWGWKIPNSWDVVEAYIANPHTGKRIIDYKESNLRLSAYSKNFEGVVTRDELIPHLQYSNLLPDAIPYNTLYYKDDWQFNITKNEFNSLFKDETYYVKSLINSGPGFLQVGEFFLKGLSDKEIIISTYMCHPSMANDNLSGVVASVELFKLLENIPNRYYSYRLVIVPETIGAICYLANQENLNHIYGGYVLYICGDNGSITYKKSYQGNSVMDKAAISALNDLDNKSKIVDFEPFGSDERQYNGPGVRLPFGSVTRTQPSKFPEYHTSADDLSFISINSLEDTVSYMLRIINKLEKNMICRNLYKGEPFFSKYGIRYPSFHNSKNYFKELNFKRIAYEVDGIVDTFSISEKLNISLDEVNAVLDDFIEKGLVVRVG
jgi:aminopeptidase-like protein